MVQSPGMAEWLKIELAETIGIVANTHFPLPSSFVWSLYQKLLPDVPDTSPYNKDRLRWRIYELLPSLLNEPEFADIKNYLSVSTLHQDAEIQQQYSALRRLQLSEKIADAYDNYLMYRPEWLAHWEHGFDDLPTTNFHQDDIGNQVWQAKLWRLLTQQIQSKMSAAHHRASLHQTLLTMLANVATEEIKTLLPERLTVFGISSLPLHQLEILQVLSHHIDVDIYWNNPCQQYWGDIQSAKTLAKISNDYESFIVGNPLLAGWGKVGRDFLDLITQKELATFDLFIEQPASNCLGHIQDDILKLAYRGEQNPLSIEQLNSKHGIRTLSADDDSILIHSCHSPLRELEILKDQLLHWFETEPSLTARDVIVMVPDIDAYAPFIDSVFGWQPNAPEQTIPYSISDRSGLAEQPLLTLFTELLTLPHSRFNASELIGWLENTLVMSSFELAIADIDKIKRWIAKAEIKWGIDAGHKSRWQSQALSLNTWLYGLQRLMVGFANGKTTVWNGISSDTSVSGLDINILAKLVNFISYLVDLANKLGEIQTAADWQSQLLTLIESLFEPHQELQSLGDKMAIQKIRDGIQKLADYESHTDINSALNSLIVHKYLTNELNETGVSQRFFAGRVNFCTLMPMRSVPFDVVCILGLNDGEFPRRVHPLSFDLINLNTARKGDRSRKLDERYLFLEALGSARKKLHLSYVGQSIRDNSDLSPSILLSELIEYIDDSFIVDNLQNPIDDEEGKIPSRSMLIKHPMQPFDALNFVDNPQAGLVKSYNKQWSSGVGDFCFKPTDNGFEPIFEVSEVTEIQGKNVIELAELIKFAKHPTRYFYHQNLNVSLQMKDTFVDDLESFEHSGLDRYQFLEFLHQQFEMDLDLPSICENWLNSGAFPPALWGSEKVSEYMQQIESLYEQRSQLRLQAQSSGVIGSTTKKRHAIELNIDGQSCEVFGEMDIVNGINFQINLGSKDNDKYVVEAWLNHLFVAASNKPALTCLIRVKQTKLIMFSPMPAGQAKAHLINWCRHYIKLVNDNQPFDWHVDMAALYMEQLRKGKDAGKAMQAVENWCVGLPDQNIKDDYLIKSFGSGNTLPNDFIELTETLWGTCLQSMEKIGVSESKKLLPFLEELSDKMKESQ